jgi:hypothetical protein
VLQQHCCPPAVAANAQLVAHVVLFQQAALQLLSLPLVHQILLKLHVTICCALTPGSAETPAVADAAAALVDAAVFAVLHALLAPLLSLHL